jgi:hypothetical protein
MDSTTWIKFRGVLATQLTLEDWDRLVRAVAVVHKLARPAPQQIASVDDTIKTYSEWMGELGFGIAILAPLRLNNVDKLFRKGRAALKHSEGSHD